MYRGWVQVGFRVLGCVPDGREGRGDEVEHWDSRRNGGHAAAMSWELLLALLGLLAFVVLLLYFSRADGDLTLLWAEWQGRRPGEDL